MPLYEYKCNKCGHRFEKIEKVNAASTKTCPECGGKAARQLAAPAIQFKGSGWYVTDYAGKGSDAPSKSESPEKSEKSEKPEGKPAAAPAAKESGKKAKKG